MVPMRANFKLVDKGSRAATGVSRIKARTSWRMARSFLKPSNRPSRAYVQALYKVIRAFIFKITAEWSDLEGL